MEMGLHCGEVVKVKQHLFGIYLFSVLTPQGDECQSIAMREDEANRIIFEKIS
jgi:Fe2+ transport system protein FeoA